MKPTLKILSILALGLAAATPSFSQAPAAPTAPTAGAQAPDQISQLAQMVGLSEKQESDIRAIIAEIEPKIDELQTKARAVQMELVDLAGPEFDETAIRAKAAELGALEGQMTASSIILQSKVDAVFTKEQREQLEAMQRQQQQMQQQMQQQQMQQQIQQQMQQMQQQQQAEAPSAEEAVKE
jgi:Spy/CpxP family protein refolding chaperone